MADRRTVRLAVIAGEESGDLLGADLVRALRSHVNVELTGVGGKALQGEGLQTLFDPDEIALMGISAVVAKLPRLVALIGKAADAIIAARPDCLVIIDSPDFTHRVARKVKKALPDLPVINYVCPSVWAWRPGRARTMTAYVDHVLCILPFEPAALERLGGPKGTYVGHRLAASAEVASVIKAQKRRKPGSGHILLLPGSRRSEVKRLIEPFGETAALLESRGFSGGFVIPAVAHVEPMIRASVEGWSVKPRIVTGEDAKWQAFAGADAALAASGTVLLELALCGIPVLSTYKLDPLAKALKNYITTWSAALPNLVADFPVIPEIYDSDVRPQYLARALMQLVSDTPNRKAQLAGFDVVRERMTATRPAGELAAETLLGMLRK